ncbi:hypothetical protein Tco_1331428 [Tanacetum coccineum]
MMEIKVQHEYPSSQTSPLLTVPVSIIPKSSTAPATTIPLPIPPFIPLPQQSTPIPTPTTIKSEVPTIVKEYLGTSLDDTLHKHKALYHALMESILEDEDAMDKGVADKSKKRKPDDADRDEGPLVRSNQGLKRKKTSKDAKPSKKAKSTKTSKGTTKSQPKSTSKSAQVEETVFEAGDAQVT